MNTLNTHPPLTGSRPSCSRGRILVVDDMVDLAQMIAEALQDSGYEAVLAHRGEAALTRLLSEPVDLAILDVDLPDMLGFDLCQMMRADERLGQVPVIFCTGRNSNADVVRARELGAAAFIRKPFMFSELMLAVTGALGATSPALK